MARPRIRLRVRREGRHVAEIDRRRSTKEHFLHERLDGRTAQGVNSQPAAQASNLGSNILCGLATMEIVGGMADMDADVLTGTKPVENDFRSAKDDAN